MKHKFPYLYELGISSSVTDSLESSLLREQRATQEEFREQFKGLGAPTGIIYPWYSEREQRGMTATGGTGGDQGGRLIGDQVVEVGAALRERLVLEQMGARVYGGLKANARFPAAGTQIEAEWKSENSDAPDGSFTFRNIALTPHRVTAFFDVSWQLLIQGASIENFLRSELFGALAQECQRVAIAGTGANNQPLGILNTPNIGSVEGGPNGAAPDFDDITQLEYLVGQGSELEHTGWLVSPLARRKLRRTAMLAAGSDPIWARDQARSLLGHPAGVTKAVPDNLTKGSSAECSAIVHGEFSELITGFWGPGVVVEAIRIGGHQNGKTRFIASSYFDSGVRAPEAFAAMLDALCSA